jgi:uracil-DNA glycosylase family 4
MFTGDESGRWLFRALHTAGIANRADSLHRDDGLQLKDCYITAVCRCAPPQNKLLPAEIRNCRPYLHREITMLKNVRVIVGLGRIAFEGAVAAYRDLGRITVAKKPAFSHGARYDFNGLTFIASFHPSQQNTFTHRLTRPMLDGVFRIARGIIAGS